MSYTFVRWCCSGRMVSFVCAGLQLSWERYGSIIWRVGARIIFWWIRFDCKRETNRKTYKFRTVSKTAKGLLGGRGPRTQSSGSEGKHYQNLKTSFDFEMSAKIADCFVRVTSLRREDCKIRGSRTSPGLRGLYASLWGIRQECVKGGHRAMISAMRAGRAVAAVYDGPVRPPGWRLTFVTSTS